jgi:hypothetical protein
MKTRIGSWVAIGTVSPSCVEAGLLRWDTALLSSTARIRGSTRKSSAANPSSSRLIARQVGPQYVATACKTPRTGAVKLDVVFSRQAQHSVGKREASADLLRASLDHLGVGAIAP